MECKNIQGKLSAYIEGLIPSEENRGIEEHLGSCEKCKDSLIDLRKTIEYVHNLEDVEPPSWLTQKIMANVRAEVKPKKGIIQKLFYPLYIKLPIEAVATVAIAIVAMYIFKTIQPEIKLAKAPSEVTKPQILSQGEKTSETPHEVPKPIEKQRIEKEPEVIAGKTSIAEEHLDFGKEKPIQQERYKALDMRTEKGARALAPESVRMLELKKQAMSITVYVKDTAIARKEVEKTVRALGGNILKTESFEEKDIFIANLDPQKIEYLNKRLQIIGEVKEKGAALETWEGFIEIKIELVNISNQP